MPYLRKIDYRIQIQSDNLNQIISNDDSVRLNAESAALAKMISKLTQKYDVSDEFRDTVVYSPTVATYKAKTLVYLDATAYSAASVYPLNSLVLQAGNVYKCTTAILVAEPFDITKWQLLGAQYDLFNGILPNEEFDYYKQYKASNVVFWKDKKYTAAVDTIGTFPDDADNGTYFWGVGVSYAIPAQSVLNTTYFAPGDNRSYQLVEILVDITLYNIHSRISPHNIPDLRVKRYDDAMKMLKEFAEGISTLDMPVIQPKQGRRIRFGSNKKNINNY